MPRTSKKAASKRVSANFRINGVQLNYVKVLKPAMSYAGDGLEFSTFLIFDNDHPQVEALELAIETLAEQAGLSEDYTSPIREPDECKQLEEGQLGLNAKSRYNEERPRSGKPILVDSRRNPINSSDDIYSGCIANVMLSLYTYTDKTGGVAVGLSGIQVIEKGPRLDGSLDTEDMFDEVEGFVTEHSFDADEVSTPVETDDIIEDEPKPKRRGRPRKAAAEKDEPKPKRRGRPRKAAAEKEEDLYYEEDLI